MGDLAQALTPKEVGQKTEFELFLISHYLVTELRDREHNFSCSRRWNYLFDPSYIVSVNWKLRVVLFLGWSSTDVLYVFSFGLQKREPPPHPNKQQSPLRPAPPPLISYMAPFILLIEERFYTISLPCCTEFQKKRHRDLDSSGKSLAFLWHCPSCTLGALAFGFRELCTGWNCTDFIT